ncbi:hypothetical protein MCOR07_000733 [Pyricularia oryzae]|nr:hypothetical protein MCOR01_006860 [Pyricularia oryzae]KAI6261146.1 hypothetical protein MCOR19_002569 [Pyricularia oryzae]KAI6275175.1 hypothetical protein MCOR26_006134 [Pyricularia oryzae]KAI6333875.1 hypothetical protein MCOR30_004158 [Pyricularia oryzae]KAI6337641.1 hypothetical protein MCOR28_008398 [Pyricularia oryzae]
MSSNVRCLGVITGKEIQPWLMEMMLDSHLHTGIDMPPQGTVIFRQQVTCVVVEAAVLATTAETINMATTDGITTSKRLSTVRRAVHSFPLTSCRTPSSYNMFKTEDRKYCKSWNEAVGFKNQQDNRT